MQEGVKEEIKDKVFEAYFTTKHQSQGTGIGLYMTYQIISKHLYGNIDIQNKNFEYENTLYRGAEFTILIPVN